MIIVGENGVGKTTLFKIIKGLVCSFDGSVKSEGDIGYLPQSFENFCPTSSTWEYLIVETCNSDLINLWKTKEKTDKREWERQFNYLGGFRLIKITSQLQLTSSVLERKFSTLSGGEKVKIHLAALCFQNPDILLLDEPTNHLDEAGIKWLEKFLKGYQGILLMITHDRYLINQTANYISELSPETHQLTHFRGNYRNYLQEKERQYLRLKQIREQQEKEIKLITKKLGDLHIKKTTYKPKRRDSFKMAFNFHKERNQKSHRRIVNQLKNKKSNLAENLAEVPLLLRRKIEVNFLSDSDFPKNLSIKLQNISKSYGDKVLFKDLSLEIKSGDKLVIKGVNGSGKSTLLKIVMGIISADKGKVAISEQVKLGYLDQEQETVNLNQTIIKLLENDPLIKLEKEEIARRLEEFGIFYPQELHLPLSQLSIGVRRKVQLIQVILQGAKILVLDEPTNHIDLLSLEKIENQLMNFPGPILTASHDRYFIQKVCNRVMDIEEFSQKIK